MLYIKESKRKALAVFCVALAMQMLLAPVVLATENDSSTPEPNEESTISETTDRAKEKAAELADKAREKLPIWEEQVKDGASRVAEKVKEEAPKVAQSAKDKLSQARDKTSEFLQDQQDEFWERTEQELSGGGATVEPKVKNDVKAEAEAEAEPETNFDPPQAEEPEKNDDSQAKVAQAKAAQARVEQKLNPKPAVMPQAEEPEQSEAVKPAETRSSQHEPMETESRQRWILIAIVAGLIVLFVLYVHQDRTWWTAMLSPREHWSVTFLTIIFIMVIVVLVSASLMGV